MRLLIFLAIGWYALLAMHHYANQRPLWNDEACVFASVQNFKGNQFFNRPLDRLQQFPRLYLFLIQRLSMPFDFSLLSLRFLPLVCMLGAFVLWIVLASREFKSDARQLMFIGCWAASIPLIYYAAELKQYSMDVLSAALFLLFLYYQDRLCRVKSGWYWWVLLVLPAVCFFSYTAFLFLVFPLYNIVRGAHGRRPLLIYTAACLAVVFMVFWFDVRVSNAPGLRYYWREYFIFFDSFGEFFRTSGEGVNNLISRWFAERPKWVRMAARFFMAFGLWQMCAGFWGSFKQEQYKFTTVNTIGLIIFIELFLLGALHLYAFTVPRTSLFFCPLLLFFAVKGMDNLRQVQKHVHGFVRTAFFVYLIYVSAGIAGVVFAGDLGAQSPIWGAH